MEHKCMCVPMSVGSLQIKNNRTYIEIMDVLLLTGCDVCWLLLEHDSDFMQVETLFTLFPLISCRSGRFLF